MSKTEPWHLRTKGGRLIELMFHAEQDKRGKAIALAVEHGLAILERPEAVALRDKITETLGDQPASTGVAWMAPALVDALRPEEMAYLAASERCETCEHRMSLHDQENDECNVPECDCGLRKWKEQHERKGHDLTLSGEGAAERWDCSCYAAYLVGGGVEW